MRKAPTVLMLANFSFELAAIDVEARLLNEKSNLGKQREIVNPKISLAHHVSHR